MVDKGRGDEIGSADTVAVFGEATTPYDQGDQLASLVGEVIAGRYRILKLLGAGGMGSVYMARDHELDDIVALKTIRSVSDAAVNRLRREVKLARRVTHHNVARTFELGEYDGARFLTMEYIEGESLAATLRRHGRLRLPRAIAILRAACSGLSAAHSAGVIHRDVKPDNVMIARDGRVVVTDFGIAIGGGAGPAASSVPGGTPAYTSPEQLSTGEVTVASDIYSTGVMAFQVLTGELPWIAESGTEIGLARLNQQPRNARDVYPELNPAVAEVVMRALHCDPARRFGTIADFSMALAQAAPGEVLTNRPVTPPTPGQTPTPNAVPAAMRRKLGIAVLPFSNRGDVDDGHLVDGLAEELIDALSGMRELKVMSRGALAKLDTAALEPHEAGATLGVDVVVGGSLGRHGDKLRVRVRAIRVDDQVQVWAGKFIVAPEELLTISDELVFALASALELKSPTTRRQTMANAKAMDLYLRARQRYQSPDISGVSSLELFNQAYGMEPENPFVNAGLAMALVRRWFLSDTDNEGLVSRAREHAQRAMAAAPGLGEPHMAMALLAFNLGDNTAAAAEARGALAKSPSAPEAHELLGRMLVEMGRLDEAKRRFDVAVELGYNAMFIHGPMIRAAALEGEWERVDEVLNTVDVNRYVGRLLPVRVFAYRGDTDALRAHGAKLEGAMPDAAGVLLLAKLLVPIFLGEAPASSAYVLVQPDERAASSKRRLAYGAQLRAEVAGFAGDVDIALQAIEWAYNLGLFDLHWLDKCPLLDSVRAEPRFGELRARVAERCHSMYDAMWS